MATVTDIENAFIDVVLGAAYPLGTSQPSVINNTVTIYAGWPSPDALEDALKNNRAHVNVFKMPGMEQNVTRFLNAKDRPFSIADPTIELIISGQTVTVTGSVSTPQNCLIKVNYVAYVYVIQTVDTLNSIAAALSALIAGSTVLANVITISSAFSLTVGVGTGAISVNELKRQKQTFMVGIWVNNPGDREILSDAIDVSLSSLEYLPTPDNLGCRIIYVSTQEEDKLEKFLLYQRRLLYSAEYATVSYEDSYTITNTQLTSAPL